MILTMTWSFSSGVCSLGTTTSAAVGFCSSFTCGEEEEVGVGGGRGGGGEGGGGGGGGRGGGGGGEEGEGERSEEHTSELQSR